MKKAHLLKKLRLIIALIFLITGTFLFIDFTGISPDAAYVIFSHAQFIPSLISLLSAFGLAGLVCVLLMILTVLFGRVYCSTICPLGGLQDVFSFLARRISKKRKRFRYNKEYPLWRYGILGVVVVSSLTGFTLLINLLDPYSNFGKIFSVLFRPLYVQANNALASLLEKFNNYWLYSTGIGQHEWSIYLYPAFVLLVVFLFSFFGGRRYCNTICPVGTLLGLLSKVSVFKIQIDAKKCNSCGRCASVCKGECIDFKIRKIDFSRCVTCYNCLSECPLQAIGYSRGYALERTPVNEEPSRRLFLKKATLLVAATASSAPLVMDDTQNDSTGSLAPVHKKGTVTPPGSRNLEHFNKTCTACHLCISYCPMHVLQPSLLQYGLKGFMQPYMDYQSGYCNYECTRCTRVCPSGALVPVSREEKKTLQLGTVRFIKENCIVYLHDRSCGACAEHCPTQAVTMVPYKGALTIPSTNTSICIGCGACEYVCPAMPNKAIVVDAHAVHQKAEKPSLTKPALPQETKEDFPF